MVSSMGIWLAATNGGMLKVDKLVYLYRLKESKERRYYELRTEDQDCQGVTFVIQVLEVQVFLCVRG